jgi:hypothetical protein
VIAAGRLEPPSRSDAGVYAYRALDGAPGVAGLVDLLFAVDDLVEGRGA